VTLVASATGGAFVAAGRPAPESTVADINHSIHVERDLQCVDCHQGVESRARAGVPGIAVCAECHDDPEDAIGRTENGKSILDHIRRREELWWPELYALPDHVAFSHARHVAAGKIACARCHGDIAAATSLPGEPEGAALTMDGCMECHARSGASSDCCACHR
jgi:hypothetical protein